MPFKETIHIEFLSDVRDFFATITTEASEVIQEKIRRFTKGEIIPGLFKNLEGTTLYEFRVSYQKMEYRLLAFWDKKRKSFIVATHGFIKKTQKTPQKEIRKAETLRKMYYESCK